MLPRCLLLTALLLLPSWSWAAPVAYRPDIGIANYGSMPDAQCRLVDDPSRGTFLMLGTNGDLREFDPQNPGLTLIAGAADHGQPNTLGLCVSSTGQIFLVGNTSTATTNTVSILRGTWSGPTLTWSLVAVGDPAPLNGGNYDHNANGIAIDPTDTWLYVNFGSRTDHGEVQDNGGLFPGLRDTPLNTRILRIPANANALALPLDDAQLIADGRVFADGVRNSYDLEFSPAGELFGTENSGDRDDPDEVNWLRESRHYGFPWRMGGNDNPQQFPGYDPDADLLVNQGSYAYLNGHLGDDPGFPAIPGGVTFEEPIENLGPDADGFRDPGTGNILDASETAATLSTVTPHKSPLGLCFDAGSDLHPDLAGSAFLLGHTGSASNLLSPFGEDNDVLQMELEYVPGDDRYRANLTRLVSGFRRPVDMVLKGEDLWVLEYGVNGSGNLWKVLLPSSATAAPAAPTSLVLGEPRPNPFNPSVTVDLRTTTTTRIDAAIFDGRGRHVRTLLAGAELTEGDHQLRWEAEPDVPSGVYHLRVMGDGIVALRRLVLVK